MHGQCQEHVMGISRTSQSVRLSTHTWWLATRSEAEESPLLETTIMQQLLKI
jgi:hypothetical protein